MDRYLKVNATPSNGTVVKHAFVRIGEGKFHEIRNRIKEDVHDDFVAHSVACDAAAIAFCRAGQVRPNEHRYSLDVSYIGKIPDDICSRKADFNEPHVQAWVAG